MFEYVPTSMIRPPQPLPSSGRSRVLKDILKMVVAGAVIGALFAITAIRSGAI